MKDGILNLLKPSDMTSQQAISAVKRMTGHRKVGHGGTLDPAAAGVLPVFLGSATRVSEYTSDGDKEYIAELRFGIETDTQDAQGKIVFRNDGVVNISQMEAILNSLPNELDQTPPAYSAIKIAGQKMADLARRGKSVEIPSRRVYIYEKQLLNEIAPNTFLIRIRCSKGTYIRTICHDLGRTSGVYAHCSFLLRTRTGPFCLHDAVTFERLFQSTQNGCFDSLLLPMGMAVSHLPLYQLNESETKRISQGLSLCADDKWYKDQQVLALWHAGKLVGIGSRYADRIKPIKIFPGSED